MLGGAKGRHWHLLKKEFRLYVYGNNFYESACHCCQNLDIAGFDILLGKGNISGNAIKNPVKFTSTVSVVHKSRSFRGTWMSGNLKNPRRFARELPRTLPALLEGALGR
jgi:hypothetical protein